MGTKKTVKKKMTGRESSECFYIHLVATDHGENEPYTEELFGPYRLQNVRKELRRMIQKAGTLKDGVHRRLSIVTEATAESPR